MAHAPDAGDVEGVDKGLCTVGVYHTEPVGLTIVGGNLRQKLAIADTCRGGQLRGLADALLDLTGDVDSHADAALVLRHIEKRLVERQGLYQVGIVVEDGVQLLAHLLIFREMWLYDDQLRAEALGHLYRLGGMHAEAARLVARRRYYAALGIPAYCDWQPPQFRTVALLDGGEELVHVDMYNLTLLHDFTAKLQNLFIIHNS